MTVHQDQGQVRITKMTCGGCGNTLAPFEKGAECPLCKMWPLCDKCREQHTEKCK